MNAASLLVDGGIIVLYFALIITIGLCLGRKGKNLEDYALGGRKLPWWAVMASIIAAETSAATFIGLPAEGYKTRGITYVQLMIGFIIGRLIVGHVFLKPYYAYRVYTVYDFLAVRFGTKSKNCVSALFFLMRILGSGVRLYVPSLVLVLAWRLFVQREQVQYRELDAWQPYAWAIVMLTIITCLYTMMGGIKAVVWTDVIQSSVMFSSALVAILTLLYKVGDGSILNGFHVVGQIVPEMKSAKGYILTGFESVTASSSFLDIIKQIFAQPYTLPAAIIAQTVVNMAAFGTDQDMVQKMLTAKDYKKSRRSLVSAAIMDIPIASAFTFIGVLLIAFYAKRPELLPNKPNDVFGAYILREMPVVVRGFVLAGVFATAMSSLSAALNALATTMTNDWYTPYIAPNREPSHYVTAARFFTCMFGALMIVVAVTVAYVNVKNPAVTVIPVALGVAGAILGPMLGVFLVGMFTKTRGSDAGNLLSVVAGLLAILFASGYAVKLANYVFQPATPYTMPHWMPNIPFTWYAVVGSVATCFVGLLFRTPQHVVEAAARKSEESPL